MRNRMSVALGILVAGCSSHSVGLGADVDAATHDAASGPKATSCGDAGTKPIVLASQQIDPVSIAVSGSTVYWANNGQNDLDSNVTSVPLCGGKAVTVAPNQGHALQVVTTPTSLIWANGDPPWAIQSLPLDGGAAVTLEPEVTPQYLATDATHVYWANQGGAIAKAALTGGAITTLVTQQETDGQAAPIAVNADGIYWASLTEKPDTTVGAIVRVPLDGGSVTTIVADAGSATSDIAVDDSDVYWTTASRSSGGMPGTPPTVMADGTIVKAPKNGGAPTTLASGRVGPGALVVDATDVYWVESGTGCATQPCATGSIAKVSLSGGDVVTLATGQNNPRALAVDGTSVYWTAAGAEGSDDSNIMKLTPK